MAKRKQQKLGELVSAAGESYDGLLSNLTALLDQSRRSAARAVNAVLAATYWEVGRRVVEFEQGGEARAGYGEELLKRLGADLSKKHGRGFGWRNLFSMRAFYLGWEMSQAGSGSFQLRIRIPPPVGLILCSEKSDTVVRYAMGGINARVLASKYPPTCPRKTSYGPRSRGRNKHSPRPPRPLE